MQRKRDTAVLIAGAGPVGLTLALDLAWRGIEVMVVERRAAGQPPEPKCNHVSARTMEIFRRLGLATTVRNAGLPADYAHDISYRTTFTGDELCRIHIPCRRDRFTDRTGADSGWPTPEPPHRINQIFLEPILLAAAMADARITVYSETAVEAVQQVGDSVDVRLRDRTAGEDHTVRAHYVVGCDGGRSIVRKAIGAAFEGDAIIQRVQSTFIRAPKLIAKQKSASAWGTGAINPRRSGMVYAIDGHEHWLVHNYLKPGETDFDAVDRGAGIRTILGVDAAFAFDVLSKEDWFGRRLIANRFRSGRIFIAGDAAHIWVPYAGFGMNAGIADAIGLSWLLAAQLQGWAGIGILDAYEAERLPITEQVSRFAMSHAEQEIKRRGAVPPEIEDDSAAGRQARDAVGQSTLAINVQQYAAAGLNFGSYYDRSPIIAYDGDAAPAYTMATFTPSTVPGCRTPHLWLDDGRSLYDAAGPAYTLLRFDPAIDVTPLVQAAAKCGMPLTVLDVVSRQAAALYPTPLLLARPDQHVAWRGHRAPDDPLALIGRIGGRT